MLQEKQRGMRDAPCPRCAVDAEWCFVDENETQVSVVCPDCGSLTLSREEFDQAEADISIDAAAEDGK